uniref:Uncharacterized protein n=1 Tax=Picea glauca TaxID=3330 RepID=A0A101LW45_PICGL|nr:hypothetical protein ABT39_MTgene1510 [Picea glauca]
MRLLQNRMLCHILRFGPPRPVNGTRPEVEHSLYSFHPSRHGIFRQRHFIPSSQCPQNPSDARHSSVSTNVWPSPGHAAPVLILRDYQGG